MTDSPEKRQLIRWLRDEMLRQSGRRYDLLELELLDVPSLRELQRLLRDLEAARHRAVQKARITPWRSS